MKIVVVGSSGLIGSMVVPILRKGGHEAVAASPRNGVNSITGEGLKEVMASAQVVIVTFSPLRPQQASATMSRYPSLPSTGPTTAISAPRSSKRS